MAEPFSIALGTITLLRTVGQAVLSVKAMYHGIRDVRESTRGLGEELEAFNFSLTTILNMEIRNGSMVRDIQGWWGVSQLDALLTNAKMTFLRLETILGEIGKERNILRKPREYIHTNQYDREISHLRLRINTYISTFNVPIVLLAINGNRSRGTEVDQELNLSVLEDRISRLGESITNLSDNIREINARLVENEPTGSQVALPICRDSEELVEIARTLASNASSVAASESTRSTPSTLRAFHPRPSAEDIGPTSQQHNPFADETESDAAHSVIGAPLTTRQRRNIESWIADPRIATSRNSTSSDRFSVPNVISIPLTETSQFSDAPHTPPSTIHSQEDSDIEVEFIKRRYKRAKDLMEERKYREAIPHLKRTLDAIKVSGESPVFPDTRAYQKVQYLLATALIETGSDLANAEAILTELFEVPALESLDRFSAAHLLSQLYVNQQPDDYIRAKAMCLMAVKGRNATLGRTHPETYASIALLCSICQISNDSDEDIWRDMLPEDFRTKSVDAIAFSPSALQSLQGHTGNVYGVVFSPDGKRLASVSLDNTVRLWDAVTGAALQILQGHTNYVFGVAFSPDGKRLASGSADMTIRLWDAVTGATLQTLQGHTSHIHGVAFSPDGKRLASVSLDNTVRLWDAVTGAALQTLQGHTSFVYGVAFSPDGKRLASSSYDNTVRLWDAVTGAALQILQGHTNHVFGVAFSPDGKRLASGSADMTIRLWDAVTGAVLQTLHGHTIYVRDVAFSPDGKRLASGSGDNTVRLWDAVKKRPNA